MDLSNLGSTSSIERQNGSTDDSNLKSLKTLMLDESQIKEESGDWLHELALTNYSLEVLNFYMTTLEMINISDLELIVTNCPSLTSLKVGDCDIMGMKGVLNKATALEEFGGGSFNTSEEHPAEINMSRMIKFPPKMTSLLGLNFTMESEMPAIFPRASVLKRLDLQYTFFSTENHCQLAGLCPNLEILENTSIQNSMDARPKSGNQGRGGRGGSLMGRGSVRASYRSILQGLKTLT